MTRWSELRWVSELRSQWAGNRRLRWGLLAIGAMLWIQGVLLLDDAAVGLRQQAAALREDVERLQPLARNKVWPGRAEDARQQVGALRSMLWPETDLGVAEAAAQDWLRALANKSRLGIRNLAVSRPAASGTAASAAAPGAASVQAVRLRMTTELDRPALTAFLAELARNEQVVIVDRLALRTASQPPVAEMDLRLLASLRGEAK